MRSGKDEGRKKKLQVQSFRFEIGSPVEHPFPNNGTSVGRRVREQEFPRKARKGQRNRK